MPSATNDAPNICFGEMGLLFIALSSICDSIGVREVDTTVAATFYLRYGVDESQGAQGEAHDA